MNLVFTSHAWDDYQFWIKTDKKIHKRINLLIKDTIRDPFEGIGKPEPLKHSLSGFWSKRINDEHRLVYKVDDKNLYIIQLRYHY